MVVIVIVMMVGGYYRNESYTVYSTVVCTGVCCKTCSESPSRHFHVSLYLSPICLYSTSVPYVVHVCTYITLFSCICTEVCTIGIFVSAHSVQHTRTQHKDKHKIFVFIFSVVESLCVLTNFSPMRGSQFRPKT